MLDAVVKSLGTILEPEDMKRVREAYAIAADYVIGNSAEFAHLRPQRLRTRLAHIVIRLARDGESDPRTLSEQALSGLRGEILPTPAISAAPPGAEERKPA
jgi:hypothetical protein